MGGLLRRSFRAHGELCAHKPWEVMFFVVTATVAMVTAGDWGADPAPCSGEECPAPPSPVPPQYQGVDVVVMTALRCGAMLYTYHQFRLLNRLGSKYILGIAGLFVVFSSLVFSCSVVQVLGSPVSDLKDAVFFFLLVIDLSKLSRLSALALRTSSASEAAATIAEGFALLGPGLTLDTCVEALLVGAGSLSGVRRLEQICQFAVLSILVHYLVLMTFFPACLSLVLQMSGGSNSSSSKPPINTSSTSPSAIPSPSTPSISPINDGGEDSVASPNPKPVWQLGYSMHCAAAIMTEESTHNPVVQRVKVIMSAGLVLVHGISRFSLVLPGAGDPPLLHTRNFSADSATRTHPAVRWLNEGLEQVVVLVLVVALLIKYAMFEGRGDLEQQLLSQHSDDGDTQPEPRQEGSGTPSSESLKSIIDESEKSEVVELPDLNRSSDSLSNLRSVSNVSSPSSPVKKFAERDTQTDATMPEIITPTARPACSANPLLSPAGPPRTADQCLAVLKADGAAKLTDDELVEIVKRKLLPGYKLESALQDCVRGVRVRRRVLAPHAVNPTALDTLPYDHYDYSKVVGVCCESVVGYVPIPVGIAGPLVINGQSFMLPLATTEGCLVASTNRGCGALQQSVGGGVRAELLHNAMTRAPVVKMPTVERAIELYHWLQETDHKAVLKAAFDGTSSFARLEDIGLTPVGRKLHLRFLASTGDAMGMNMVSKGVEAALKILRENFPDLVILSISGNLCTDKKPSAVNWVKGRGKTVVCGAVIPGFVVRSVLKTTVAALVECHVAKNLEGAAMAGSIGGNNAHAANIVAAMFIACGQDPAQVVGSSNCITQLEAYGPEGEDLSASVTLPSLEVGTVGGGTALPAQAACLHLLGVRGAHPGSPGENAEQLALVVAGAVLAGELSLMAALTAGHLVSSHMKHNRSKAPTDSAGGAPSAAVPPTDTAGSSASPSNLVCDQRDLTTSNRVVDSGLSSSKVSVGSSNEHCEAGGDKSRNVPVVLKSKCSDTQCGETSACDACLVLAKSNDTDLKYSEGCDKIQDYLGKESNMKDENDLLKESSSESNHESLKQFPSCKDYSSNLNTEKDEDRC